MELSLSNGALIIHGERKVEPEATEYYARERYYGHVRRRMKLAEGIDGSKISASFKNGLLEVIVRAGVHHQEPERIEIG